MFFTSNGIFRTSARRPTTLLTGILGPDYFLAAVLLFPVQDIGTRHVALSDLPPLTESISFLFSSPPSAITTVLHPLHDTVHDGHLLFLALSFSIDHFPWAVTAIFYLFGCLSVSCFSPILSVGGGLYNGLGGNNNICRLNLCLSTQHNTCGSLYYSPRVANIVRLHSTASFCYLDPD